MDPRPSETISGVVDRISGSGNAMLQTAHGERNLGPLPQSIVGEEVAALGLDELWAVCLSPRYMDEEYLSSFLDKGVRTCHFSESKIAEWDSDDAKSMVSNLLTEEGVRSPPPQDLSVGDEIEVDLLDSDAEDRWLAHYQNTIVYVEALFATAGLTLEVAVKAIDDSYIDAEISPAIDPQTELGAGESIRIEPRTHDGEDTYAVFENMPVCISGENYPIGEEVIVGVETVSNVHIAGSFSAIDSDRLPEVGATISLDATPETGVSFIDALPFYIEPPLLDTTSSPDICVTEISDTAIEAVYDVTSTVSADVDDEITVEIEKVSDSQVIGRYQDMPVVFSHGGRLSDALTGATVSVQVAEVDPDRLSVSLTAPNPPTVEIDEDYRITVLGRSSNYAVAVVGQTPIVVESNHLLQEGNELRVRLTEVHQDCIEGSVSALPGCPSEGKAIRISAPGSSRYTLFEGIPVTVPDDLSITAEVRLGVEAVNSDGVLVTVHGLPLSDPPEVGENIVASIVQTSSSGTFAVSDGIPVFLPIYGISVGTDVAIRVNAVEAAYIRGFITKIESDTGVVELSNYQEEIQSGTRDIRQESFADATTHFKAAAEFGDEFSGITAVLPRYTGALTAVINALHGEETRIAESALEDAIETFPKSVGNRERKVLVEICHLRLQAVEYLLQAIQGVFTGSGTNLQHIYQESVARSPLREAAQVLQEVEDVARGTPYEDRVPGILLQRVMWLVDREFSSLIDDLSGWVPDSLPDVSEFTWPYQSFEEAADLGDDASLGSEEGGESVELSSFDADAEIGSDESTIAEPVEPGSAPEAVDADGGTVAETGSTEDSGSEIAVGSVQSASDDLPTSEDEDSEEGVGTTAQPETVEESPTPSESYTSSSDTERSASTEVSTVEVVTEVEDGEIDSDLSELRAEAEEKASSDPVRDTSSETTVGSRYQRAPAIRDYALARADGVCECCDDPAPFRKPGGEPYLEVHHVDELGEGGEDHPDKVVALCPVCHKRIHHGEDGRSINDQLAEKLEAGLADVGTE